jgi:hypothetical protein
MRPAYLEQPRPAKRSRQQKIGDAYKILMDELRSDALRAYNKAYTKTNSKAEADLAAKLVLGASVYNRAQELGCWPYYYGGDPIKKIVGSVKRSTKHKTFLTSAQDTRSLYDTLEQHHKEKQQRLWVSSKNDTQVSVKHITSHDLYTVRVSRCTPLTCVGLYTTRAAAVRVAMLISNYPAVKDYVLGQYDNKTTTDAPQKQIEVHTRNGLKINEPIGRPKENISYHAKSGRLKIQTPEIQGYTAVCPNLAKAYALRSAILSAGDLTPYIEVERP